MQGQVSPRSHERYAELCRKNIVPLLGGLALTKSLASGRRDGTGRLSARTVTHMHRVLREALQQAVRWQMLACNPADAVKPPKVERKQMKVLDATETVAGARSLALRVRSLLERAPGAPRPIAGHTSDDRVVGVGQETRI